MPLITWGPQIEIGIKVIDKQHRRLVDLINQLDEALKEDRGGEVMGEIFAELIDYTHTHFRYEEGLLSEHGYEEYRQHCREHLIFTDQIEIYKDRFDAGMFSVTGTVMEYLRGWLLTHITSSDRAYIETLKSAGVS